MSWIGMAAFAIALSASFGGLSWATVHIDTAPQLRNHGRRPLVSTGWAVVALTFAAAALYVAWLIDTLLNRGLVTPRDGMFYVPLLVLGLGLAWGTWAGIAYWRSRPVRQAARDARMAPSAALSPASGGEFRRLLPPKLEASAKGVVSWVIRFTKGSRHE